MEVYRGTSLIRKRPPLGTYCSICLGPYGGPRGVAVSYERVTLVEQADLVLVRREGVQRLEE